MKKMQKISATKWKPVHMDGVSVNTNLEGLIGIEECLDYNQHDFSSAKKKKTKRKSTEANTKALTKKRKVTKQKPQSKKIDANDKENTDDLVEVRPSKSGFSVGSFVESAVSTKKSIVVNNQAETEEIQSTVNNESETEEIQLEGTETDVGGWQSMGLPKGVLKAISELKFKDPTTIQAITLPTAILGRRDILGAAETGSGKTLAFGLPIITGIMRLKEQLENGVSDEEDSDESDAESEEEVEEHNELKKNDIGCVKSVPLGLAKAKKPLYALILTPTRELAVQVKNHLVAVCKYTGIRIGVVVGGMAAVKQERVLNSGPEIVVATPGRFWELLELGNRHLSQLENIKFLAIDETDRMIERGHFQELHQILERINFDDKKRQQRQNFVFSATLTMVHELPKHLLQKKFMHLKKNVQDMSPEQKLAKIIQMLGISDPKVVDITQKSGTSGTLTECRITCDITEKDYYLYYFLQRHPGRTLIFCNSIGCVRRITTILTLLNCQALPLHSAMHQRQRLNNLDKFRQNPTALLIATDVAARGLDIPQISHVLHYQTPRTAESYVHRSGRTARATLEGLTLLLVEPGELQSYFRLCRTLAKAEDIPLFPIENNFLNAVKERVNSARDLDRLQLKVKKTNSEVGWLQKAAEEMDMIIDDHIDTTHSSNESKSAKKAAEFKRKHLQKLLSTPIFPSGFSGKYPLLSTKLPTTSSALNGSLTDMIIDKKSTAIEVMKQAQSDKNFVKWKNPKSCFKPRIKANTGKELTKRKKLKNKAGKGGKKRKGR